jgi:hypothetical protein
MYDRKHGAGFYKALGRCNPKQLSSILTKYLASGDLTNNTLYSILELCKYYPQLAAFDEQTLTTVRAFPEFPVSSTVIAVLRLHILNAVSELSSEQAHSLMDRLQIWPSLDLAERLKGSTFTVLIEFLEQSDLLVPPLDGTFRYLSRRCPRENYPLLFQRRFAAWFLDTLKNHQSMAPDILELFEAIESWLYSESAGYFDNIGMRRILAEALENYLTVLPQDNKEARYRVPITVARLKSHPNMDHRQENLVSVDDDATTEEWDSSQISCDDDYNTPASLSQVDLHE